jgi:cell division transport system permease protein
VRSTDQRRVLDEAGGARAMTWVMAVMLFLTLLAAGAGIGLARARGSLAARIAGRVTVQVADGDAAARPADAARLLAGLRRSSDVRRADPVDPAALAALLRPWLGADALDPDLPVPALIDADLVDATAPTLARVTALAHRVAPTARVDPHASWMAPVARVMTTIAVLAGATVLLMAAATALVVVLAARAGLEAHRPTIEVMHMLGSTDAQVARLFQRRLALDAGVGGAVGGMAALAVLALVGRQLADIGSDLLGAITLGTAGWVALAALPLLFTGLAVLAARLAVVMVLRRTL